MRSSRFRICFRTWISCLRFRKALLRSWGLLRQKRNCSSCSQCPRYRAGNLPFRRNHCHSRQSMLFQFRGKCPTAMLRCLSCGTFPLSRLRSCLLPRHSFWTGSRFRSRGCMSRIGMSLRSMCWSRSPGWRSPKPGSHNKLLLCTSLLRMWRFRSLLLNPIPGRSLRHNCRMSGSCCFLSTASGLRMSIRLRIKVHSILSCRSRLPRSQPHAHWYQRILWRGMHSPSRMKRRKCSLWRLH